MGRGGSWKGGGDCTYLWLMGGKRRIFITSVTSCLFITADELSRELESAAHSQEWVTASAVQTAVSVCVCVCVCVCEMIPPPLCIIRVGGGGGRVQLTFHKG